MARKTSGWWKRRANTRCIASRNRIANAPAMTPTATIAAPYRKCSFARAAIIDASYVVPRRGESPPLSAGRSGPPGFARAAS
jgi:hypothetical protein